MSSDSRMSKGERSAKYLVHRHVHRGVHLKGQRNSRVMRRMATKRWFTLYAAKSLNWAGATPSCRKIAARSLLASGVTTASCCWNPQLVFWPRRMRESEKS